jgi:primase-polymerase (primpol)-like protein
VNPENIPHDLRTRPRWLCWVYGEKRKGGKWPKVPVSARTGNANIDATDRSELASFADALDMYESGGVDGVGFSLAPDDPYAAVDLDGCVDPATRTVAPWADAIRSEFGTYSEVSPSGTGLRLVGLGGLDPAKKHNAKPIEVYDRKHYVTITGHRLPDAPLIVTDCAEQFRQLQNRITPTPVPRQRKVVVAGGGFEGPDAELLERAFAAKNGSAVRRLWRGRSRTRTPSQDLIALANYLAFWTGPDALRLERLITDSPLFAACEAERKKWLSPRCGGTWGQMHVITPAIKDCSRFFAGAAPRLLPLKTPPPWKHCGAFGVGRQTRIASCVASGRSRTATAGRAHSGGALGARRKAEAGFGGALLVPVRPVP